ncbi:MAG TPA: hypothetical protein VGQ57_08605, partial [Polyangiaceae bacterium]|nr:hypothetical protein [Polyangiaceae bacterium]
KLWSLSAEGGIHAPFGALEPYGTLALGYVSVGSIAHADSGATLRGFDARLAGGLDYYLTNMFSLGVNAGVDLLVLSRSGGCTVGLSAGGPRGFYCADGSSLGGAVTATALAGLHF